MWPQAAHKENDINLLKNKIFSKIHAFQGVSKSLHSTTGLYNSSLQYKLHSISKVSIQKKINNTDTDKKHKQEQDQTNNLYQEIATDKS